MTELVFFEVFAKTLSFHLIFAKDIITFFKNKNFNDSTLFTDFTF
jgi:hypothetical protein